MPIARLTQTIGRPVNDVFSTVIDVPSFPQWNPTTAAATRVTDEPVGDGTRFLMKIRGFGEQQLELQEFERDRRVRLVPHSRMFGGGHRFVFTPRAAGATVIEHELEMKPKGVFVVLAPLMGLMARRNLSQTAAALERHLRPDTPSPR